jgi:RNA polymerase sigma-70 factor, ECF subfamily
VVLSVANLATATQSRPTDRFDDLFRLLYPSLVPLAERLLSDRAESEDVVQEAFLRLARVGHNADAGRPLLEQPDEVVGAWLRRVTMNLGINRLRDRRRAEARLLRATRLDTALDPERGPAADDSPTHALLRAEARDEVQAALATLPERQRTCLLLRHAGHSYGEIAEALGIAVGSVGVYLQRGERAFRSAYRPNDSDHHPQPE